MIRDLGASVLSEGTAMLPANMQPWHPRRGRFGVAMLVLLLAVMGPHAARAYEGPLIGGSLTWDINRNFKAGSRTVSLTLKTAWMLQKVKQCNHLIGNKVSMCSTPAPEPMARLGRLCFYLCDTKGCDSIRDDRHLNTSHLNDFTVEHFDTTHGYMSGSLTIQATIPTEMVNMFAFLCFDETDPVAVGARMDWYGEDSPTHALVRLQPSFAGAPTPTSQTGRYYGTAFLSKFGSAVGAGKFGRKAKLLSTFLQFCCHQCSVGAAQQVETLCDDVTSPNSLFRNLSYSLIDGVIMQLLVNCFLLLGGNLVRRCHLAQHAPAQLLLAQAQCATSILHHCKRR